MSDVLQKDLDPALLRQRRSLIITSLGLVLFNAAGGEVTTLSVSNIGLKFQNPEMVLYLAWCAWVYFLWRFWIYSQSEYTGFVDRLAASVYFSDPFEKWIVSWGERIAEAENKTGIIIAKTEGGIQFGDPLVAGRIKRGIFRRKATLNKRLRDSHGQESETPDEYQERVSWFFLAPIEWKCFFSLALKDKDFSDIIVPYLIAICAPFTAVVRHYFL